MTKKQMAIVIVNSVGMAENNAIAYGHDYDEALKIACEDAGITVRQYKAICEMARG